MTNESTHTGDAQGEWYYCFRHKKVETRNECHKMDRMGPYSTVVDAETWHERALQHGTRSGKTMSSRCQPPGEQVPSARRPQITPTRRPWVIGKWHI